MAAEAKAEGPGLGPAPPAPHARGASPEKRGLPVPGDDDGEAEEERRLPEPKRRRAYVAALDGVPGAAVAEEAPDSCCEADADDGACFSFQHARGGFLAPETAPKFGSFNPPAEAELKPAEAEALAGAEADDEVPAASAREAGVEDDSSQLVAVGMNDERCLGFDHPAIGHSP